MKTKPQTIHLIAQTTIAGISHSLLSPEDRADIYEGLGNLLPPPAADAARYTATCIRESQRAQQELITALRATKPTP